MGLHPGALCVIAAATNYVAQADKWRRPAPPHVRGERSHRHMVMDMVTTHRLMTL